MHILIYDSIYEDCNKPKVSYIYLRHHLFCCCLDLFSFCFYTRDSISVSTSWAAQMITSKTNDCDFPFWPIRIIPSHSEHNNMKTNFSRGCYMKGLLTNRTREMAPKLYEAAATVIEKTRKKEGSVKTLCFSSRFHNKKQLAALVLETIKRM